jgi:hypothetical protein
VTPLPTPSATATLLPTATPPPAATASPPPPPTSTSKPNPPPDTATPVPTSTPSATATPTSTPTATSTATPVPPVIFFDKPAHTIAEDGRSLSITVILNKPGSSSITVNYATSNGSAFAPNDYLPNSGRLIFAPGQISRTISLGVIDDAVDDPDNETVRLALSEPVNATLGLSNTVVTITDNDPLPQIQFSDATYSVVESGVPTFTVTLDRPSGKTIGFTYGPVGGTATTPQDYDPVFNIRTASPDVTGVGPTLFTLSWAGLKDDAVREGRVPETIVMELAGLTNLTPGPQITSTLFIIDDD